MIGTVNRSSKYDTNDKPLEQLAIGAAAADESSLFAVQSARLCRACCIGTYLYGQEDHPIYAGAEHGTITQRMDTISTFQIRNRKIRQG